MTATGSSLIRLHKQSCARERSIYVCGELLISPESAIRHTQRENSNVYAAHGILGSDKGPSSGTMVTGRPCRPAPIATWGVV